ncbi:hypothetical protein AB0F81_14490 [Actinoplanes sp. NPDC024001]|uniref:hypothetical protein n=1 Tax=Actinoplanes sp. NPDC024001 TaxID=3154598 RepID=UPI0033E66DC2
MTIDHRTGSSQGMVYCAFIEQELQHEIDRRAKLDVRSTSLVTSSGAFIVLLIGIGAFSAPASQRGNLRDSLTPLMAALSAFIGAAALGAISNAAVRVSVVSEKTMKTFLRRRWTDHNVDASNNVAVLRVKMIACLRQQSVVKARLLTLGIALQVAAFSSLTWTLYTIAF